MSYHSYVVQTPDLVVVVDTCIGNHKTIPLREAWELKATDAWMSSFAASGLRLEDVDLVVCTHLHVDHVGWNTRLVQGRWEPTFPHARYLFLDREFDFVRDWPQTHPDGPEVLSASYAASFDQSIAPIVASGQLEVVAPDHNVGRYLRFVPTPGHTPGHTAYAFGATADAAVFTGDMFHTRYQFADPSLCSGGDDDRAMAIESRVRLLERYVDTSTMVYTAHLPEQSGGRVVRTSSGFALV